MREIKALIFDLDGTLVEPGERYEEFCALAAAKAAQNLGLQMPLPDAIALAQASFAATGNDLTYFVEKHNLPYDPLYQEYNEVAAAMLPQLLRETGYLRKVDGLADKFNCVAAHRPVAVLTHAPRCFARPVLDWAGLQVRDDLVFTHDHPEIAGRRKDKFREGFEIAARGLGVPLHECAVIDNTAENMALIPEAHRVLIGPDRAENEPQNFDARFDSAADFLQPALFPELAPPPC